MKKRIFKIVFITIILAIISYLAYSIVSKNQKKNVVLSAIKNIPDFNFITLDSIAFSNNDLKPNLYTIFIYFNSDCDYCHNEAQSISVNLQKFEDTQIVFVSTESLFVIKQFSKQYSFTGKLGIYFVQDYNNLFSDTFNANTIPYTLIYDKNSRLLKKHKGQYSAKGILKVLE